MVCSFFRKLFLKKEISEKKEIEMRTEGDLKQEMKRMAFAKRYLYKKDLDYLVGKKISFGKDDLKIEGIIDEGEQGGTYRFFHLLDDDTIVYFGDFLPRGYLENIPEEWRWGYVEMYRKGDFFWFESEENAFRSGIVFSGDDFYDKIYGLLHES